jgi:hypothetical protein
MLKRFISCVPQMAKPQEAAIYMDSLIVSALQSQQIAKWLPVQYPQFDLIYRASRDQHHQRWSLCKDHCATVTK